MERKWIVQRTIAPGILDTTHLLTVYYMIEDKLIETWYVDLKLKKVLRSSHQNDYIKDLPEGGWWLGSLETPEKYQEAMQVVEELLKSRGEDSSGFYVTAEKQTKQEEQLFYIWYKEIFKYKDVLGDPTGKCRNMIYNYKTKKITKESYWR